MHNQTDKGRQVSEITCPDDEQDRVRMWHGELLQLYERGHREWKARMSRGTFGHGDRHTWRLAPAAKLKWMVWEDVRHKDEPAGYGKTTGEMAGWGGSEAGCRKTSEGAEARTPRAGWAGREGRSDRTQGRGQIWSRRMQEMPDGEEARRLPQLGLEQ